MKTRAPAHLLRTYAVQHRAAHDARLQSMPAVQALTSTGALVQAAHRLARLNAPAVEIVVTESGV